MVNLTRFVYQDGDAFAVYYARFNTGHASKKVEGLISLGEWGEGSLSKDRLAFPFRIWSTEEEFQVGLIDKEESTWKDVDLFGEILDRNIALQSPLLKDVFHITDHMVTEDKPIMDFFSTR